MLLLCSGSPRRRDFLLQLGLPFTLVRPEIDETQRPSEPALDYVERLAREKAEAGLALFAREQSHSGDGPIVPLAADTVVVLRGLVLGKPRDRDDTRRMLRLLSGTEHEVITSVRVAALQRTVSTTVRFRTLSDGALEWLVRSGDGDDKAGAYAVQGLAAAFVEGIEGSLTNVIGLPLSETLALLARAGVTPPWT
jgi:septum formation protein